MKLQLPHRLGALVALALILCFSSACGGGSEVAEGPIEVELGPGTFDLADTRVGLAGLSSYKATLTLTFDGTEGGQAQQWSSTFEMIRTREPRAGQLNVQQTGSASEGDPELPEFMAEKDGASYQRLAEGGCAEITDSGNSLMDMLEPAGQLRTVFGASAAGHEAVNGIEADKYTFDERALARTGLSDSTGEMWVSTEGGYVVRYVLTVKGDEDFFGEGMVGIMTWDYELSEVNQLLPIELPADCLPGLVNAPLLSDASNVVNLPGLLAYDTGASVLEARTFYEQEFSKLGWQPPAYQLPEGISQEEYDRMLQEMQQSGFSQPTPTPDPSEAFLVFEQGDQMLYLLITHETTGTHVQITLSPSPK